jgi:FkbM family methyltransferase
MVKQVLRFCAPAGVLEVLRAKRAFDRIAFDSGSAWRAALSPTLREMLESSRLGSVPLRLLGERALFVDVGANVGAWSEAALRLLGPRRLIAVEPAPEPFVELKARVGGRPGVTLLQCAVGAEEGTAMLHRMERSEWNSLLPLSDQVGDYYPTVAEREPLPVRVAPLDALLAGEEHIDLLKVDVQGGEWAVMDGARETLKRTRVLMLETNFVSHYRGDTLFVDLHRRMTDEFGFELFRIANPHHSSEGKVLYADAVYVRAA